MKKITVILATAAVLLLLAACGNKAAESTGSTQPGTSKSAQETGSKAAESTKGTKEAATASTENKSWIPEASGKYVDGKILYDQMNWDGFEKKDEDIVFFGLPGSRWNWDTLKAHSEGIRVMTAGKVLGDGISFDDLQSCEEPLQNTVQEGGHKCSYDYSLSLNSSHSPDMYVFGFKPADVSCDVEINFPTHDHDVKVCDAYGKMGFYLLGHTRKDKYNYRTEYTLEAFGDEFYDLVCPHGTSIKNSFAGEYVELLMKKLGKPTGVIEKVRAEFFNNYQWFMYWERNGYVICIKVDESERSDNWSSMFCEPVLITDSIWEFIKEETLTNDENYKFKDIRF